MLQSLGRGFRDGDKRGFGEDRVKWGALRTWWEFGVGWGGFTVWAEDFGGRIWADAASSPSLQAFLSWFRNGLLASGIGVISFMQSDMGREAAYGECRPPVLPPPGSVDTSSPTGECRALTLPA